MSEKKPVRLYDTTRRTFLKAAAAVGVVGAGTGTVSAQATTFQLGGESSGWVGRSPSAIQGQTNPTLELEPGTTYVIEWENVDGAPHNVVISDGSGTDFVRSPIMSERGTTQTVEFTAEPGMSTYYCEIHPESMRGDISTGAGGATQTETQTEQPSGLIEQGPSVGLKEVASGPLQQPIGFTYAEEDQERYFVSDQNGYIYVHGPDGLQEEPFLDIHDDLYYLTDTAGNFPRPEEGNFDERGLLGLAFHPEFEDNRKFYVRYSAPPKENMEDYVGPSGRQLPSAVDHTFRLSEFTATDDGSKANPDSERVLLEIPQPQFNHNSGDIAFGDDDYLYVTAGDGGGANDDFVGHVEDWYDANAGGNGQDVTTNLLGSILRIDVDEEGDGTPYAIPDDNPLVGRDGFDEQWAWGFRNPWRMSFNDGDLYAADVGQALYEEVDIVEAGGNYGWNVKEGTKCFSTEKPAQPPESCPSSTPDNVRGGEKLLDPVIQYPHTHQGNQVGTAVTGGYVYQGDAISEIEGDYVFGDWSRSFTGPQGRLFVSTPDSDGGEDGTWGMQELVVEGGENGEINRFVNAFGRDREGEVYVLTSTTGGVKGQGAVYKIVPAGEGDQISAPAGQQATTTEAGPDEDDQSGTEQATTEAETTEAEMTEVEAETTEAEVEAETTEAELTEMETETTTDEGVITGNDTGQPGFGALATLGGIGSAVAYLLRRNDDSEE